MPGNLRARIDRLEAGNGLTTKLGPMPAYVLIRVMDHRPGEVHMVDVGHGWVKRPKDEDKDAFIKRVADEEYRRIGPGMPGSAIPIIMHISNRSDPLPRLQQSYRVLSLEEQEEKSDEHGAA